MERIGLEFKDGEQIKEFVLDKLDTTDDISIYCDYFDVKELIEDIDTEDYQKVQIELIENDELYCISKFSVDGEYSLYIDSNTKLEDGKYFKCVSNESIIFSDIIRFEEDIELFEGKNKSIVVALESENEDEIDDNTDNEVDFDKGELIFDFVEGYIHNIENTFCPHCKAELIHELALSMYNMGKNETLLSAKELIDNVLEENI